MLQTLSRTGLPQYPRCTANYPRLRAALDALFANRLPDVQLLTGGGPGLPMLAASMLLNEEPLGVPGEPEV